MHTTRVALILPRTQLEPDALTRTLKACASLGTDDSIEIYAEWPSVHPAAETPGRIRALGELVPGPHDTLVTVEDTDTPPLPKGTNRHYLINGFGQVTTPDGHFDPALTPGTESHVFSRLLPRSGSTHGYFPYLPLLREQRLRPIDPFGHRIAGDFTQLIGRGPDHIVVAVFGGSAAQGVNVIFEGRSHMVNATTPLVSQMVSSSQEFVEAGH